MSRLEASVLLLECVASFLKDEESLFVLDDDDASSRDLFYHFVRYLTVDRWND